MTPDSVPIKTFGTAKNDMAYWYPKISVLDVPIPETHKVELDTERDGPPRPDFDDVLDIVEGLGGEAFVRSGYKSASTALYEGSYIMEETRDEVENTVGELLMSHMMMEMPTGGNIWVREMLDLEWCNYCSGVLAPECRVFIRDGHVVCYHPRLSEDFDRAPDGHRESAEQFIENAWKPEERAAWDDYEQEDLHEYAQIVADDVTGDWSVDFVLDTNGDWWLTDMAVDAVYDISERNEEYDGYSNISEHPGHCEHDYETMLDDEYVFDAG